jgi:hypothetical protein
MDYGAVQQSLAQSGQGAMIPDVQKQQQADMTQQFQTLGNLVGMGQTQVAVNLWNNSSLSQQFGKVELLGTKGEWELLKGENGKYSAWNKMSPFLPDGKPNIVPLTEEQATMNQTKEQLYARSVRGDKEATAILNKMQSDELKVAKEKSTFKIDTAGAMTPEAIDMAATRFRMTGEVPKLGTGGAGTRWHIRPVQQNSDRFRNNVDFP